MAIKIGVVGCTGRMGRLLVATALKADGCTLAGGTEVPGNPAIGADVALLAGLPAAGLQVGSDAKALFAASDVVVDFTVHETAPAHAALAADTGTALVIGTTGLSPDEQRAVEAASRRAAVLQAANMSVGVNLLLGLTRQAAATLGPDYDIEIVEMHHRHKVDAPSGTALALGRAAAEGRQVTLDRVAQRVRDGHTGPRKSGDIGFAVLRGGDVAGDHTVIFAAEGERLELGHKASSRQVFATGAIRAARWLAGKPPGLYSMRDVLGLS